MSQRSRSKGVEPIEVVLDRWLRRNRAHTRIDTGSLYRRWSDVVGEAVATQSRVVDLTAGVLVVEVDSAPLLQELSTYYREEILASLRRLDCAENITDIRFRAGVGSTGRKAGDITTEAQTPPFESGRERS